MTTFKLNIPEVEQIPSFVKILDDLSVGNNVFLKGPAGTGKTTLGEKIAYSYNGRSENDKKEIPFVTINCNQWTSPTEIKGGQTIEGYKEGALIEAWRDGKILILDEMPKLDANTAGILNDALAKSAKPGAIIFNGLNEPFEKHPKFGVIATGNVLGKGSSGNYVGNNKQDASLLDRFSGSIYQIGFNKVLEESLIYPVLVHKCWDIRNEILKYEGTANNEDDTEDLMTLRTMLNFQRIYELEMKRITGQLNDQGKPEPKLVNGKTLKDCIESYFLAMNADKAQELKAKVELEAFYNSYNGRNQRQEFISEYTRRAA